MASNSGNQASQVKEYVVRVPKLSRKRYNMMRFSSDLGQDYFKTWSSCKMERENNMREYKMAEELPKFGAGSEFGREQRDEARRKRYGINVKKYKSENQPWMLNVGGKNGKKFKGIREGGVSENVSWYVFMQGKDGAFEAYPVDEFYNFQPINRYKALSAEEAEEEFVRRDKIMNYFQVMYEKKFKKEGADVDEDEGKKKGGSKKSLLLSEMDDWVSDDDDEDDDEAEKEDNNSEDDGKKKKKKEKHLLNKKRAQGGKKNTKDGEASDDSCLEESDEYNEGAEHDYISGDSSDSDQQNDEIVNKQLAGVEEGDALKKLLASDDEDEDEENKDKSDQEDKNNENDDKKKTKKKKSGQSNSDDSSQESSDETKKKKKSKGDSQKNSDRKKTVNELKRKAKENPLDIGPSSKKMKMDGQVAGSSSVSGPSQSLSDQMEEALRRYLLRKPMTTTELLKQLKKKINMSSEQLVTHIAVILKKVNPNKRMIKGKMYLSLKPV